MGELSACVEEAVRAALLQLSMGKADLFAPIGR
jgi:hypothetical protein